MWYLPFCFMGDISMKEKTIRASKLSLGDKCFMTLYGLADIEDGYEEVEIVKVPASGIQAMTKDERLSVKIVETEEVIEFRRNNNKPYFLVTDILSNVEGKTKLERVKFWKYE